MLLSGPSNSSFPGTTTADFAGFGTINPGANTTTEIDVSSVMPSAFQANSLYVIPNTTENTTPHQYIVFQNGVATSLQCTAAASSAGGCCVNLTGTGTIGGSGGPACTTAAATLTVAVGDTLPVEISCPGAACVGVSPGIGVGIVPSVTNQVPLTAQLDNSVGSTEFVGFEDNNIEPVATNFQMVPQLTSGSMTFSNLIVCTGVNPGGSTSRTITSQSAAAPGTTPTAPSGATVALIDAANGACPGANASALLGGFRDTTDDWTASAGNVVINAITTVGSPATSTIWKTGMVVTVP